MRLVDHGLELFIGELEGVVARHDLDEVGATLNLFTYRSAHLVGSACFPTHPVRVATGLDDCRAAHLQSRARNDALLDGLL